MAKAVKPLLLLDAFKKSKSMLTATLNDGTAVQLQCSPDIFEEGDEKVIWLLSLHKRGQENEIITGNFDRVWQELQQRGVSKMDAIWFPA